MENNMGCLSSTHLNLTQCLRIRENQYRSADNRRDYEASEIEDRIHWLQSRQADRDLKKTLLMLNRKVMTSPGPEVPEEFPPQIPAECCEGLDAQYDWMKEPTEYIRWNHPNGFSYQLLAIPSRIMEF